MICLEQVRKFLRDPVHFVFCIAGLIFLLILAFKMDINKFLMSAASAFFGAGAAFLFNDYSNKKDEKRRNMAVLIRTRYIIDKIALIRTQLKSHIDKYKNLANDDFFEWEKIPEYDVSACFPDINVNDLLFLLDDNTVGEHVLNSILLVCAESEAVMSVLNERNQMYITYLNKTEERDSMRKDQIEIIIGFRLFKRLELYTQRLIDTTNNLIEDCDKAKKQINNLINQVG